MPWRVMCMLSSLCRSIRHGGLYPPQERARPAQQREVCGGRPPVTVCAHPAAPSPAPPGLQSPPGSCCSAPRHTGDEAGMLWTFPAFGGHLGAAQRSWIGLWTRKEVHSPPPGVHPSSGEPLFPPRGTPASPAGCIRLAQECSHRPGGASTLRREPASPPGWGCIHFPEKRSHPAAEPRFQPPPAHPPEHPPAHPELPWRPGAGCGPILSSHGGNPARTAPPDGCEEPNAS